jgi:hypothetical protein
MDIHSLYSIFFSHFRSKRLKQLYEQFEIGNATRILDVGGSLYWWELARKMGYPVPDVTIMNLYQGPEKLPTGIKWIVGDGKNLPFGAAAFDLVFSNSVIEHLGDWDSQRLFAEEIRRVGLKYCIQTPNRNFFIEPHLITPFIHWLPLKVQMKLLGNFTVWGLMTRPSVDQCESFLREVRLLTESEMAGLFPDSIIVKEKFCGLTKSIISIKR